jgi:hypothetical protein
MTGGIYSAGNDETLNSAGENFKCKFAIEELILG